MSNQQIASQHAINFTGVVRDILRDLVLANTALLTIFSMFLYTIIKYPDDLIRGICAIVILTPALILIVVWAVTSVKISLMQFHQSKIVAWIWMLYCLAIFEVAVVYGLVQVITLLLKSVAR
ncbi:hypothetical protein TUM12370_30250 [Salmonella enterica subsp. enterica serovar Choleraesuis]|nr:hypothetical protein TUM12370_30250 [Salmonella enterica subsp. enterica serovar Choleraesuis]